jgi:hypothetical protein
MWLTAALLLFARPVAIWLSGSRPASQVAAANKCCMLVTAVCLAFSSEAVTSSVLRNCSYLLYSACSCSRFDPGIYSTVLDEIVNPSQAAATEG